METPTTEEKLKLLPYSELKKYARIHGVKANMKAEKIIAALLSGKADMDDSFLSMEQQIINSSKKNKEEKFNNDKMNSVVETPRRETYTVENSEIITVKNKEAIMKSASPELDSSNITMSRGSERVLRNRKVSFVTPIKSPRVSFSSPKYISLKDRPKTPIAARISEGRRVSFVTPNKVKMGPKQSLPTTPHPMGSRKKTRMSKEGVIPEKLNETPQNATFEIVEQSPIENITSMKQRKSAPLQKSALKPDPDSTPKDEKKVLNQQVSTPLTKGKKSISFDSVKRRANEQNNRLKDLSKQVDIELTRPEDSHKDTAAKLNANSLENLKPSSQSMKRKRSPSPKLFEKNGNSDLHSSNRKKILTPNFKAIHEKAFNKMESIDEYQKRKAINSAKKIGKNVAFHSRVVTPKIKKTTAKAPHQYSGIPFIPTVTQTKKMNLNFTSQASKNEGFAKENKPVFGAKTTKGENANKNSVSKQGQQISSKDNKPLKRSLRFDLKASLSKKLPYKPHSGPLKPVEINLNSTMNSSICFHKHTESQNSTVQERRLKSRSLLHGVRTNRRFELQMSKRA